MAGKDILDVADEYMIFDICLPVFSYSVPLVFVFYTTLVMIATTTRKSNIRVT
jgi:hypothetical protein